MNKSLIAILVLVVLGVGGYLIYSNTQTTPTQPSPQIVEKDEEKEGEAMMEKVAIEIKDFKYSPTTLRVKSGEKITVTNRDVAGHSVTSNTEGLFDSGVLGKDKSGSITAPNQPGTYPFHCTPHPNITGVLVVEK